LCHYLPNKLGLPKVKPPVTPVTPVRIVGDLPLAFAFLFLIVISSSFGVSTSGVVTSVAVTCETSAVLGD
jgi:hypothetical protein